MRVFPVTFRNRKKKTLFEILKSSLFWMDKYLIQLVNTGQDLRLGTVSLTFRGAKSYGSGGNSYVSGRLKAYVSGAGNTVSNPLKNDSLIRGFRIAFPDALAATLTFRVRLSGMDETGQRGYSYTQKR